jgi:FdhD protein
MISPQMMREFVIGHLYSSRLIQDPAQIESLRIEAGIAKALIPDAFPAGSAAKRLIVSGCGGETSFLDESGIPRIRSKLRIETETAFNTLVELLQSQVHKQTGGVHSVGLFAAKETICIAEDVGRHNALDKVIGYGLERGIDFSAVFAASTGRISSEMVLKCARANIPLILSRGATTSLAIEIARKAALTLIGFVRGNRMNIYTGWERICRTVTQDR